MAFPHPVFPRARRDHPGKSATRCGFKRRALIARCSPRRSSLSTKTFEGLPLAPVDDGASAAIRAAEAVPSA